MALSPQDQAYWKNKLGWKAFVWLFASTAVIGMVVWPLMLFIVSWFTGHADDWNWSTLSTVAGSNFWLALLVSLLSWLLGQFYRYMDWLPARR
jgi:hypothetical protein